MGEKILETSKLTEEEKYILGEGFRKVKKQLLEELNKELKNEKNPDKKLLIMDYISKLKNLTSKKIQISNKTSEVNGDTTFINLNSKYITIYSQNLSYQTDEGKQLLLYHEIEHFIGRDKQGNFEYNNNIRELNAKLLSFRYFMKKYNYELSIAGIDKLLKEIKKEMKAIDLKKKIESGNITVKNKRNLRFQDLFTQSEEVELFYIYERFYNKKQELLERLQDLVFLDDLDSLKKEVKLA